MTKKVVASRKRYWMSIGGSRLDDDSYRSIGWRMKAGRRKEVDT